MSYLKLGLFAAIALAFLGLGVYAWDADRALAKCTLARVEDARKALEEAARLKQEDEKAVAALREKHDQEKVELRNEAQSREDKILKSRVTVNGCPAIDSYINSVRDAQKRTSGNDKSGTAGKPK